MLYVESVSYSLLINGDQQYELLSRQLVSVQKSVVMFSPNVGTDTRVAIFNILGMKEVITHGTYQGIPSSIGSSKKEIFSSLIGRLKSQIEDWKPKLLSKAAFNKLCRDKAEGGLGFRDNHAFNIALLSKQDWRIASNPLSQLAQMYRVKYYPYGTNEQFGVKSAYKFYRSSNSQNHMQPSTSTGVANGVCIELTIQDEIVGAETFQDLFEQRRVSLHRNEFLIWVTCMWDLWYQWNRKLNGETFRLSQEIKRFAEDFLTNLLSAPQQMEGD
ncbi:hypothetical protein LIER_15265 [Lithospermum erythrorhizon]|uniref:Uncharacterized protein n=1 Tax=Lithospermum erythrorhizon TaxID=34254 RepID=A0AAV3Q365_LITER